MNYIKKKKKNWFRRSHQFLDEFILFSIKKSSADKVCAEALWECWPRAPASRFALWATKGSKRHLNASFMWTNSNARTDVWKSDLIDCSHHCMIDKKWLPLHRLTLTFCKDKRQKRFICWKGSGKAIYIPGVHCVLSRPLTLPINLSHVRVLISWAKSWIWNLLCVRVQL